jgi:hypothetical protein
MFINLDVTEPDGTKTKVTTGKAKRTCSPFFAITPVYCGKGTWNEKLWNLTHIPSGMVACYGAVRGVRKAETCFRILAAVLTALGNWSTVETCRKAYDEIPDNIRDWMRRL